MNQLMKKQTPNCLKNPHLLNEVDRVGCQAAGFDETSGIL